MASINILIAADAVTLAAAVADHTLSPGNQESPTPLDGYSQSGIPMCMMTEGNIMSNIYDEEWIINVNSGDMLRWEMTTFNNSDHTVFPYSITFNVPEAMSPAQYIALQTTAYFPASNHPEGPFTAFLERDYCAQSAVLRINLDVQYSLAFALVNNSSGIIIGYFSIDAFIKVS